MRLRRHPSDRLARAVVRLLERDLWQGGVPAFRVVSCRVEPLIEYGEDEPDRVRISVDIVGVAR
jgi:hypothetical protein